MQALGIHRQLRWKDVPVIGNNPEADMIARTRVNASTVKSISKKSGKATTTQTSAPAVFVI